MKKSVLIIIISFMFITGYAQNKTLGVGATAPNPNAALHVESPSNNQGFIMPRLTSANRTAPGFQSVLTTADVGLMVYDTDLKAIYIWDGAKWGSAAKLAFPYQDSVLSAPANSNLLKLYYGGSTAGNVGLAYFENLNPNNAFAPIFARTNGTGSASNFIVNNTANTGAAVNGTTNGTGAAVRGLNSGTGSAANFTIANPASTAQALRSVTNGSGAAIGGSNTGTADGFAGLFNNSQSSNTFPAIQAGTAGPGPGVRVIQNATSIGGGMDVFIQNTTGTAPGFSVDQQGLGNAGRFTTNNPANAIPALDVSSNGTGYALQVISTGTGENAMFSVNNPSSSGTPVVAQTNGTGLAGLFQVNNSTGGTSALMGATNSNVGGALAPVGVYGRSTGTGSLGGAFRISNAGNSFPALYAETNGTGASFSANNIGSGFGIYARATGTTDAIYAEKTATDGAGSAGNFWNKNSGNGASTLYSATNAATGTALGLSNSAQGDALAIFQGGVRISTATLSGGGVINVHAAAYLITDATNAYTFSGGISLTEGSTLFFYNAAGADAFIDGFAIPQNNGIMAIYMGGSLRYFNYTAP